MAYGYLVPVFISLLIKGYFYGVNFNIKYRGKPEKIDVRYKIKRLKMVNKNKIGILKHICIYNHTCVCISVFSIYTGILALKARLVEVDQMTYFSSILLTLKIFEIFLYQAPKQ